MLDNLQHRYLLRLECANEAALEGKLDECRNICWELRLKSDDSLYTRAMVNLTLIDVCPIEEYPDKLKFAEEALRLAEMLQKEEGADKEAGWLEKELADDAREAIEEVKAEESKLAESKKEVDSDPEHAKSTKAFSEQSGS